MKAIWFFYIGAVIDLIALLLAIVMMVQDELKGRHGTNNSFMFLLVLVLAGLVILAFYLKSIGKTGLANIALWIPGFPLAAYGLLILLFLILKPGMK